MYGDEFFAWLSLKLFTWYYNRGLTNEQKAENALLLAKWETGR